MMNKLFNNVTVTVSVAVIAILIVVYVLSVASPVIDQSIIGLATVIGYGSVVMVVIGLVCVTIIAVTATIRLGGSQWIAFLMLRADYRKASLQSEFDLKVLAEGERGFLITRPDSEFVGRPLDFETTPFSGNSLPDHNAISLAQWQFLYAHAPSSAKPMDGVPLLEGSSPLPLLDAIAHADNILIVGGKGTGKTTLMQHIEAQRLAANQDVIVLDSHALRGQWQGQTIGQDRNYSLIKNAMIALVDKLHQRYTQRSAGQSIRPMTTIIDEFTLLPRVLKDLDYNVQDYSLPVLTEGRKVGINAVWGVHSDRVAAMGLKGASDIKECFDATVYLKNVKGSRYALVDFGEGVEEDHYAHPGPFRSSAVETAPISVANWPQSKPVNDQPTDYEMTVIQAFISVRDGGKFSWRKATQSAFGEGKYGKNYNERLVEILDKFDIDHPKI